MNRADAAIILATLAAGFHNEALEPETVELWTTELQAFNDPRLGGLVARQMIRTGRRFPSLRDYRASYHAAARSTSPALPQHTSTPSKIPEWVMVWWWATRQGETRGFPQQGTYAPPPVMTTTEYAALREQWITAGAPSFSVAALTGKTAAATLDDLL